MVSPSFIPFSQIFQQISQPQHDKGKGKNHDKRPVRKKESANEQRQQDGKYKPYDQNFKGPHLLFTLIKKLATSPLPQP
jgi:hypothetical protein